MFLAYGRQDKKYMLGLGINNYLCLRLLTNQVNAVRGLVS